jgi:hypothetical protein
LLINEEFQVLDGEIFNQTIYYIGQVEQQGEQGDDGEVTEDLENPYNETVYKGEE